MPLVLAARRVNSNAITLRGRRLPARHNLGSGRSAVAKMDESDAHVSGSPEPAPKRRKRSPSQTCGECLSNEGNLVGKVKQDPANHTQKQHESQARDAGTPAVDVEK